MTKQVPSASADPSVSGRLRINAFWFLRLRWAAVAGQLVTIGVVDGILGIALPTRELLSVVGLAAVSNAFVHLWFFQQVRAGHWEVFGGRGELLIWGVMVLDILLLSLLLFFSGGPTNPFATFYLANIALAAVMFHRRWVWTLAFFAFVGYVTLVFYHRPLPALGDLSSMGAELVRGRIGADDPFALHVAGKIVAFIAAVAISIHFMTRVTAELARRDRDLVRARQREARSEKLEALATLAAGAAHELASPLSTIAVIAKDLERDLEGRGPDDPAMEDARLIRQEVARCRSILDEMAARSGESTGGELENVALGELIESSLEGLRRCEDVSTTISTSVATARLFVPRSVLERALRSLIKNALDATPDGGRVRVVAEEVEDGVEILVEDRGSGMSPETLARVGDPFFTTKEPGSGMGLGVFLSRTIVDRLGGRFELESSLGVGTKARVWLPRAT